MTHKLVHQAAFEAALKAANIPADMTKSRSDNYTSVATQCMFQMFIAGIDYETRFDKDPA